MNFLLILSHKKSTFRENQRQHLISTNNGRFIFYYFIGDLSLESDYLVDEVNNIVYLKIPDNYESLSLKTYHAMKFIYENYPDIEGVMKTDDDIDLDIDKLFSCIDGNKNVPYFGIASRVMSYYSSYHFGKCESPEINKKLAHVPETTYCGGGGYYVSKSSITNILNNKDVFESVLYEDMAVGISMNRCGVFPLNVNIKRNGCMWGEDEADNYIDDNGIVYFKIPNNNKVNTEICACGAPKDRRISNFCQKCHKLY